MKFPVFWSGLDCYTVECSEILAYIELLYNPRVNKVFTSLHFTSPHFAELPLVCISTQKSEQKVYLHWQLKSLAKKLQMGADNIVN